MIFKSSRQHSFEQKHVVITGGSSGIGLGLAEELLKLGARVTLIARSDAKLAKAKTYLIEQQPAAVVYTASADVTRFASVVKAIQSAEESQGAVYGVFSNAGTSIPGKIIDQDASVFSNLMDLNYMGTVHVIKAVLPGLLLRRQGHIVVISSVMAIIGFTGYASYASSKWAVRGFCDCLRNELAGSGVSLSVAYPPDTDTPGYAVEKDLMPADGREVANMGGETLFPADKVAKSIVRGAEQGDYHLHGPDMGLNVLVSSMAGFTPRMYNWLAELFLAPLMVLVARLGVWQADRIVRRHAAAAHTSHRQ